MGITNGWPFPRPVATNTKHELTRVGLNTHLSANLKNVLRDTLNLVFNLSGVLPFGVGTPLNLVTGAGNDSFRVTSGCGIVRDTTLDHAGLIDWTDPAADITFENAAATTYYFGMQVHEVPLPTADGIRTNSGTGKVEYIANHLEVGQYGHPDAVVDLGGGQVRLTVTTLCLGGGLAANHGDRAVRVWLNSPVDPSAAIAFPTGTTGYLAGAYNVVLGDCGQLSRVGAVSLDVNDYWVIVPGPAVSKTTNIGLLSTYLALGHAHGNGPSAMAVMTPGAYRYGSALGTIDADVWTLFRDVYTAPSRDGDGAANLPFPLQTLCATMAGQINTLQLRDIALRNTSLLQGLAAVEAVGPPMRRLNNVGPALDQIITKNMEVWWGIEDVTGDQESIPGATIDPPDNQVSLIVIRHGSPSTFEFLNIAGGTYADTGDVIIGMVAMVGTDIVLLHFFPQWSNSGRRLEGLTVQRGNTGATYCLVQPGRFFYWRREYVNPYSVDLSHADATLWVGGAVGGAGWVHVYAYVSIVTENQIRFKLSMVAPGPDGWYPGLAAGSSDFLMRYVGAVYWTGAVYLPQWTSRDGKVLCGSPRTALTGGVQAAATLVNLSALVPPTARAVLVHARITGATTSTQATISSDSIAGDVRVMTRKDNDAEVEMDWVEFWLPIPTQQSLWYRIDAGAGALDLLIAGYEEDREQPGSVGAPLIVV